MKLIVGLGNPGKKYENTRHNAGYIMLDEISLLLKSFDYKDDVLRKVSFAKYKNKITLLKTLTFMNESGLAVSSFMNYYKIKPIDLIVIHDDLDIKLGDYKMQFGVGPKLHNGISSIEQSLGVKDFFRVRLGVDARETPIPGEDYVLAPMSENEKLILKNEIRGAIKTLFAHTGI